MNKPNRKIRIETMIPPKENLLVTNRKIANTENRNNVVLLDDFML
ncbi:hypothetical protein P5F22_15125 [Clostridium perfringens]|nr:hypothetical protein [Clostridium perfringens]